jgi:hypothetical protein
MTSMFTKSFHLSAHNWNNEGSSVSINWKHSSPQPSPPEEERENLLSNVTSSPLVAL